MLKELLLTVLVGFLVSGLLVLLAVWRAVRWVRRSGRLRQRVRTAQALVAPPGPRREVAWLRRELAAATRASTEAVALVRTAGGVVGELPGLARRLGRVAGTLDAELRLLAGGALGGAGRPRQGRRRHPGRQGDPPGVQRRPRRRGGRRDRPPPGRGRARGRRPRRRHRPPPHPGRRRLRRPRDPALLPYAVSVRRVGGGEWPAVRRPRRTPAAPCRRTTPGRTGRSAPRTSAAPAAAPPVAAARPGG
jgi:hypothetical protein